MKKKILIILGTRPEIIRLSCTILRLNKDYNLKIVNTNQNSDKNLNKVFFKELKLPKLSYSLKIKNKNPIYFISKLLIDIDKILIKEKPDAILNLGDTNSSISLYCAKRKKIPIFHIEAGNRSFDLRVPEEINRSLIDKLSDINLTYSEIAKGNLIKENYDVDKVIKVGSPLYEVLNFYKTDIIKSKIINKLKLKKQKYILVSCHREENVDSKEKILKIFKSIIKISQKYKVIIIFSTHPRVLNKINDLKIKSLFRKIKFYKPFGYFDYINLQINSLLTISDSGSISEESNILNFPAINLRETTERQETMEKGNPIISGLNINSIIQSAEIAINNHNSSDKNQIVSDYVVPHFSRKISGILQSYIDYINRKIWYKKN